MSLDLLDNICIRCRHQPVEIGCRVLAPRQNTDVSLRIVLRNHNDPHAALFLRLELAGQDFAVFPFLDLQQLEERSNRPGLGSKDGGAFLRNSQVRQRRSIIEGCDRLVRDLQVFGAGRSGVTKYGVLDAKKGLASDLTRCGHQLARNRLRIAGPDNNGSLTRSRSNEGKDLRSCPFSNFSTLSNRIRTLGLGMVMVL